MYYKSLLFFVILLLFNSSCEWEPIELPIDEQLKRALQVSCNNCSDELAYYTLVDKNNFDAIPQDLINNPITSDKVRLGKLLFHETALAQANINLAGKATYSCASCHYASAGFQANRFQGLGEGGEGFDSRQKNNSYTEITINAEPIRTPSLLNVAYQDITLWNGALGGIEQNAGTQNNWVIGTQTGYNNLNYEGVETQAISGIEHYRMDLTPELIDEVGYKSLFDNAFESTTPETSRYTNENTGLAIAAYERTITSSNAPFQQWLRGNLEVMSNTEKEGAILFFGKAGCATCHNGPALNGWTFDNPTSKFAALGMKDLYQYTNGIVYKASIDVPQNQGRGAFTDNNTDFFKFKVPQLYNLKDSPFYGHGSSFTSVNDIIQYKNAGIPEKNVDNISEHFIPLGLSDNEISDLVEFIENALYDNELLDYQPSSDDIKSGNCIPNNDLLSIVELGCQ